MNTVTLKKNYLNVAWQEEGGSGCVIKVSRETIGNQS